MAEQRNTPNGRYYDIGEHRTRPSVTTILGQVWPAGGLEEWRYRNLAAALIDEGEHYGDRLTRAASSPHRMHQMMAKSLAGELMELGHDTTAADRGTRIHKMVEQALKNDVPPEGDDEEVAQAEAALQAIHERCPKIHFVEAVVAGTEPIPYAGTVDLIASWKGDPGSQGRPSMAVIDLKTGRRPSRSWAPQIFAYANADQIEVGDPELKLAPRCTKGFALHVVKGQANWYEIDMQRAAELWFAACRIWNGAQSSSPVMREV